MSKHSKNNTANPVFTHAEREKLGYGTKTARLTRDNCKDFDACFLCLRRAIDPVCCQKGHLACKECIYKNLLEQKKEIKQQQEIHQHQVSQLARKANEQRSQATDSEIAAFLQRESGFTPTPTSTVVATPLSTSSSSTFQTPREAPHIAGATKEDRPNLPSFWIPGLTPDATPTVLKEPDTNTYCTAGDRHVLKTKQLHPVTFTAIETGSNMNPDCNDRWMCPSCRRTLSNNTNTSVLRTCGHLYCNTCIDKFVKVAERCQVCDKGCLASKDIIPLAGDGTGYAGHGEKVVVKRSDVAFTCT